MRILALAVVLLAGQSSSAAVVGVRAGVPAYDGGAAASQLPLPRLHSLLVQDPGASVFSPSGFQSIRDSFDIESSPAMLRLHSPVGFRAMVEGEPEARRTVVEDLRSRPDLIKGARNLAYFSLSRVMESDRPMAEKVRDADDLSRRYAEFFDGVGSDPSMPEPVRRQAVKAREKLLDSSQVIDGLAAARQLNARLMRLEDAFLALKPAASTGESSAPRRTVPSPVPKSKRSKEGEAPVRYRITMADMRRYIEEALFDLERIETRGRLAADERYGDGLRAKVAERSAGRLEEIGADLPNWKASVSRFWEATIGRSFIVDKIHRIDRVPRHPGLSLTPEPGGFLLRARFKTDFQDPEVRRVVKRSIESYWRGSFTYLGRAYRFRTKVSIEPLRPGESFPADHLELADAKGGISRAGSSRVTLGEFGYDTPAHEFGHVLGLEDDYRESYDPEARAADFTLVPGSIMGSADGSVLPRHLKLVYQLLRRHRLLPAPSVREALPAAFYRGLSRNAWSGALRRAGILTEMAPFKPIEGEGRFFHGTTWSSVVDMVLSDGKLEAGSFFATHSKRAFGQPGALTYARARAKQRDSTGIVLEFEGESIAGLLTDFTAHPVFLYFYALKPVPLSALTPASKRSIMTELSRNESLLDPGTRKQVRALFKAALDPAN